MEVAAGRLLGQLSVGLSLSEPSQEQRGLLGQRHRFSSSLFSPQDSVALCPVVLSLFSLLNSFLSLSRVARSKYL